MQNYFPRWIKNRFYALNSSYKETVAYIKIANKLQYSQFFHHATYTTKYRFPFQVSLPGWHFEQIEHKGSS